MLKIFIITVSLSLSYSALANGVGTPHSNVAGPETTDIMGYGTPGGGGVENELRQEEEKEKQLRRRQQRAEAEEDRIEEIRPKDLKTERKK
jgi:hypothetical protein